MKKISKLMMAAVMMMATVSFASCSDDEKESISDSNYYSILYMGRTLEAGQTVYFNPTDDEITNDFATVTLLINNKTEQELNTKMKIEKLSGPEVMNNLLVCYGETCTTGTCPWTSSNMALHPGVNQDMAIKIEYSPSQVTSTTKYRITVGEGGNFKNPQVMYLELKEL